jgi:hypothetical protein
VDANREIGGPGFRFPESLDQLRPAENFSLPPIYFVVQSISMNEQERAEEHLRTIRRLMERATIYRAISAPTALVGGVLSLLACGFFLRVPFFLNWNPASIVLPPPDCFLPIWLVVLLLTAAANTLFIVIGAKKRNEPVFSASMKAALYALAPAFIAGGVLTFCFGGMIWDPMLDFIIGIGWAAFYGLGLLATAHFAPRSLTLLGWAFFLSSMIALLLLRLSGQISLHIGRVGFADWNPYQYYFGPIFMALTFGLFHLIYAACAWPRKGAAREL